MVHFYQTTWRYIAEDSYFCGHSYEIFKSRKKKNEIKKALCHCKEENEIRVTSAHNKGYFKVIGLQLRVYIVCQIIRVHCYPDYSCSKYIECLTKSRGFERVRM